MVHLLRRYQFRWCLVLIIILSGSSLLPRIGNISCLQALGYIVPVALFLSVTWIIQAYFRVSFRGRLRSGVKTGISITICVVLITVLTTLQAMYVPKALLPPGTVTDFRVETVLQRVVISFFLSMISYIVLNIVFTTNLLQKTQLENERLKQADLRARLSSLQQQISPHFLFNSLSTLKTIAKDAETKNFIIQLSHVYRYLLSFNEVHLTTLRQEIRFMEAYMYILHERFDDALQVNIQVPEAYYEYGIPPLSLQLLVENAIKHNAFSADAPLRIDVEADAQQNLRVCNNLRPKNLPEPSTKLGLQNINDRFMLLMNRQIVVDITDKHFTVTLPIVKDERSNH